MTTTQKLLLWTTVTIAPPVMSSRTLKSIKVHSEAPKTFLRLPSKKTQPVTKFDHAQARLKWARASRDNKLEKIREVRSEMEALKKEMDLKSVQIRLLKQEREDANKRVQVERKVYREELVTAGVVVENQMDPRILDGYSSEIAYTRSSSVAETASCSVNEEIGSNTAGDGAGSPSGVKTPIQAY